MKKTYLIIGSIALLCVLLIIRLMIIERSNKLLERKWFAKSLQYEFSAQVDRMYMVNEKTGRLWCRLTAGDPQVYREDSLKRLFKEHDLLYLIIKRSVDSIIFVVPNGNLVALGDCVRVSSQQNSIQFFSSGKPVAIDSLSNTLMGWGRPFFLKRK